MSYTIDELSDEMRRNLVFDVLAKKRGESQKDWSQICLDYDLECSPETLRKAGVGIKLAHDAEAQGDNSYIERQKIRDLTNKLNEAYRTQSRSELLRETVEHAVKRLEKSQPVRLMPEYAEHRDPGERSLVVMMGDFHYGADICVHGLYGEILNEYDSSVFKERMEKLLSQIRTILEQHQLARVHLLLVGDLIDGMLRQSQLVRLEHGMVDSTIGLSEYLSQWINELSRFAEVVVAGCTGNHSEIRPLRSKAREFQDENLERIVFWYLASRLSGNDRVVVVPECERMNKIEICGYSFVLLHGDGEQAIEKIAQNTVNLYGEKIDYFVCGHLHKEQEFLSSSTRDGNSVIIRVPSLCGMNAYEQSKGYGGRPGATAMIMESGVGRRCVYPIAL